MKSYQENGRSLLEIVAVLAIMGIFTYGSIAAFQAGMSSVRAKYIMEQVQLRVSDVISMTENSKGHKRMVYTPEYARNTDADKYGYSFKAINSHENGSSLAYYLAKEETKESATVEVTVSGKITPGVCGSLKEKIVVFGDLKEAKTNSGVDIVSSPCPTTTISSITFKVIKHNKRSSS